MVDASLVVVLTLANKIIGAMGVVARRAAAIQGVGDAAISGEAGVGADDVGDSRAENAKAGQLGK